MFSGGNLLRRSAMRNAMALSGLFVIVLSLCGFWMVAQIRAEVRADIDAQLASAHRDLVSEAPSIADIQTWFTVDAELAFYTDAFRDADGRVFGTLRPDIFDEPGYQTLSTSDLFQPRYLEAFDRALADLGDTTDDTILDDEIDSWRVFVGPLQGGQIAIFEPISGVEGALALIPRVVLTVGAAMVATTLLAGAVMAGRQQRRLDDIRQAIARIGRGDLSHRGASMHVRDDLDEIMVGIDAAASELDGSISRLRLFSQNVAHELRTPLARLRASLESAPDTPQVALDRTDDVIRTLDAVHRIARLSHRPDPGTLTPVALADIAAQSESLFAEVAADHGQTLRVDLHDPAVVQGDAQLLAQLVANLVENAIRYAGNGAQITIRIDGRSLSVCDTGPGIAATQDLTEPFARADHHRSQPGSGLGLALVKTIARYHGAELSLTSQGGLIASVAFPA